tara:strand:+ start:206 stop:1084 length:879 start_codon:yes stop_codon:yes gene_type:complete
MKAIVTGGAGFIGTHLVKLLLKEGHQVEIWDNLSTGKLENVPNGAVFNKIDLTIDVLPDVDADYVFHLAAPVSVQESLENPYKYEQGCYMTTKRLLDWSITHNIKGFVLASTAAVYGNPTEDLMPLDEATALDPMSPYAEWKLRAEHLLAGYQSKFGLNCTALRFFNVYGEGQHDSGSYAPAVALFLKQFEAFKPITVTGDGMQTRDYVYVGDVVNACYRAILRPEPEFRVMNVGTGEEISIIEIAESFGGEIKYIAERDEPKRSCANNQKVRRNLGWSPSQTILNWIQEVK